MTHLLETNVIVDVLNNRRGRPELLLRLAGQGALLACTGNHVAEVYSGARQEEIPNTDRLLRSLRRLELDWSVSKRAGEPARDWRGKGRRLRLPDLLMQGGLRFIGPADFGIAGAREKSAPPSPAGAVDEGRLRAGRGLKRPPHKDGEVIVRSGGVEGVWGLHSCPGGGRSEISSYTGPDETAR